MYDSVLQVLTGRKRKDIQSVWVKSLKGFETAGLPS
jgi:hypothetical protein